MFIPLAMRNMGVDYEEYVRGYLSTSVNWSYFWHKYLGRPEPLYVLLNYLARWTFHNYQGVNIICAALSVGFTFAGIYKFKDKVNIGAAIWCFGFLYYIMMYGLNRMMISVSIISWAWQYYFSRNTKKFIIWSVISGLFHYAGLLMIPLYFVLKWMEGKSFTLKSIKWFRMIFSVFAILTIIYVVVPKIFGNYIWFIRYSKYFELSFNLSALNNNAATYLLVILVIVYRKKLSDYLEEYKSLITMLFMYIVLSFASVIMPIHRITYYFYPVCVILYSAIPTAGVLSFGNGHKKIISNIVYYLMILLMGFLWIYQFLSNDLWGRFLIPYRWGTL